MIRLFAALAIPEAVADRLEGLQVRLPGRVVPSENFHLTLAFFGELRETTAEDLHTALDAIDAPAFDVTLESVGAFGRRKPHAIYAAARPEPALDGLREKVAQAARRAGLDMPSRRYVPHVTLTRLRPGEISAAEAAALLSERAAFLANPFRAEAFHLYRSDLGRGGPRYEALADYPLR